MKILTVTLNPALDKYYQIKGFFTGHDYLAMQHKISPGGKGINVSRALKCLEIDSDISLICAGRSGDFLKRLLNSEKMNFFSYEIEGETRTNITVTDPKNNIQTRILEQGPAINIHDTQCYKKIFKSLIKKYDAVVFSGRPLKSNSEEIYKELIKITNKNTCTVLDTSGESLKNALKAKPYLVKINELEAEVLLDCKLGTIKKRAKALRHIREMGGNVIIITLGKEGSIAYNGKELLLVNCTPVKGNTVGCGDSLLAGFLYGMNKNCSFENALRFAIAAGAANLYNDTPGYIDQKDFFRIEKCVKVVKLEA